MGIPHTRKAKILFNSWDLAEASTCLDKATFFFLRNQYEAIEWILFRDWQ